MLETLLVFLSWLFILTMFLLIVVPYLRGRADLVTAWNMFLAGSALFVGYATIAAVAPRTGGFGAWGFTRYVAADYLRYCAGVVVFFATIIVVYYKARLPRRLAGRLFLKWPPNSAGVLYLMLPVCALPILAMFFAPNVHGLGPFLTSIGFPVIAFVVVFSFVAWYKHPINPVLLATFVVALMGMLILASIVFGRRPFVGVLASIPIALYWLRWRYRRPLRVLVAVSLVSFAALCLVGAYLQVREFGVNLTLATVIERTKNIVARVFTPNLGSGSMLVQDTAACSLLTIHMYTHELSPKPFNAAYFVLVNPIPRAIWPGKPDSLGHTLPADSAELYGLRGMDPSLNLGPGIIGHGYHEGGLIMLVFYAILAGLALRFIDEILMRQPDNPYFLGFLAASSGHIVGWARGDIGNFSLNIIGAGIAMVVLCWMGRLAFGTGLVYPRTENRDAPALGMVRRRLAAMAGAQRLWRRRIQRRRG
ncbi:MAG: hypothetical protein JW809_07535 [Pirellulales bacterium]|nr:hypothetical protein [Pirellulales bacterium]